MSAQKRIPQVDTTTYGKHSSGVERAKRRRHGRARTSSPSTPSNANVLITRRNLLLGAAGLGVVAAGAAGAMALSNRESDTEEISTLKVPEDAVFDLESCAEVDTFDAFEKVGDFELPFGTLLWANDDTIAACLFPTEEASPLVHMGILHLPSGASYTMRESAVGAEEGFEIYDVRASSSGMVWMEAAIMEGRWRIYVASLSPDLALGEPQLVEEGDSSTEIPSITIIDDYAYWQCMAPISNENARKEPSSVRRARVGEGKASTLYESVGRMSAPINTFENSIIFTPRHKDATSYCDLIRIDASSGKVLDSLTLPSGMYPHQVAYGATGFSFCFENIYDYGGGISNLGSYSPAEAPKNGGYSDVPWFRFNRTPTTAPCWCGDNWFMVKSNQSVCAVNFANKVFCSFGVESGCLDWGDFLISGGKRNLIVTALQIDDTDTEGNETKMTQVRVWQALGNTPDASRALDETADVPYEANVPTSSSESDDANQA